MNTVIITDVYDITVTLTGDGGGSIVSGLHEECPYCGIVDYYFNCDQSTYDDTLETKEDTEGRRDYNSAIDGIESMILGHAVAGIDITTPEYKEGIETAVQAVSNNF